MIHSYVGGEILEYCSSNDIVSFNALIQQIENDESLLSLLMGATLMKGGQSPLHVAVQHGSCSIVEAILKHSTTIGALEVVTLSQNSVGETPLHLACAMGNLSAAMLLLSLGNASVAHRGADCVKDQWGRTPWQVAVENGYDKKLAALLAAPYNIHSDGPLSALYYKTNINTTAAAVQRDPQQELLAQGIRQEFLSLLASKTHRAAEEGDGMMQQLQEGEEEEEDVYVTVKTIFGEYSERIRRRRPRPAHSDAPSSTRRVPMMMAQQSAMEQLLPVTADPTTTSSSSTTSTTPTTTTTSIVVVTPDPNLTPAAAAVLPDRRRSAISKHLEYPGDPAALKKMVANSFEFDVNGKDMFGLSALHKLSSWDNPDLLAILLLTQSSERVDVRSVTAADGFTCLHCAVHMRALASLQWLLRALPEEVRYARSVMKQSHHHRSLS